MRALTLPVVALGVAFATPAMATPQAFQCSAPIGRDSSIWRYRTAGPPFRIRGRVLVDNVDPLPAGAQPGGGEVAMADRAAQVQVIDFAGYALALSFRADPEGRSVDVGLRTSRGDRHDWVNFETRAIAIGAWIPFELSFEANRAVVRVGSREVPLDIALTAGAEVRISAECTGGEFSFRDLEMND